MRHNFYWHLNRPGGPALPLPYASDVARHVSQDLATVSWAASRFEGQTVCLTPVSNRSQAPALCEK